MSWQDITYTVFTIVSGIGLSYSLFSPNKPDFKSSALNLVSSIAFATVQFSLGLIMAFICTSIIGVIWAILMYQKWNTRNVSISGDEGCKDWLPETLNSDYTKTIIFPK